jgi:hypothetical protein
MMSSVMPSPKYCCSTSPLMLTKGRTAMDGLLPATAPPAIGRRARPETR